MASRFMNSRYTGTCRGCGGAIEIGARILWSRGAGARHDGCTGGARPDVRERSEAREYVNDDPEIREERARKEWEDSQYAAGAADAERYMFNKRAYGSELAEMWEMDEELARYNRGEDY